jgi:hypothetical protein
MCVLDLGKVSVRSIRNGRNKIGGYYKWITKCLLRLCLCLCLCLMK